MLSSPLTPKVTTAVGRKPLAFRSIAATVAIAAPSECPVTSKYFAEWLRRKFSTACSALLVSILYASIVGVHRDYLCDPTHPDSHRPQDLHGSRKAVMSFAAVKRNFCRRTAFVTGGECVGNRGQMRLCMSGLDDNDDG